MIADAPLKKDVPDDGDWSTELKGRIAYGSDRLLSLPVETWTYTGGAHGNYGTRTINIDLKAGRPLTLADLTAETNQKALVQICLEQVLAQKKEKDVPPPDATEEAERNKALRSVVTDLQSWTFKGDAAEITFDPYAVGSFVEGEYTCDIPYVQLRPLAKPAFPLPQ